MAYHDRYFIGIVLNMKSKFIINIWQTLCKLKLETWNFPPQHAVLSCLLNMCYRLTKLSVTMCYTLLFGIFDDTSLWILPETHDPSLCDTPDDWCLYTNRFEAIYESKVVVIFVMLNKIDIHFKLIFDWFWSVKYFVEFVWLLNAMDATWVWNINEMQFWICLWAVIQKYIFLAMFCSLKVASISKQLSVCQKREHRNTTLHELYNIIYFPTLIIWKKKYCKPSKMASQSFCQLLTLVLPRYFLLHILQGGSQWLPSGNSLLSTPHSEKWNQGIARTFFSYIQPYQKKCQHSHVCRSCEPVTS